MFVKQHSVLDVLWAPAGVRRGVLTVYMPKIRKGKARHWKTFPKAKGAVQTNG